jgi:hypothetical protein
MANNPPNDRPLFDDEELPLWLRNAGILPAGKASAQDDAMDLDWLTGESPAASGKPAAPKSGLTGELPWLAGVSDAPGSISNNAPDIDWLSIDADSAENSDMSWLDAPAESPAARVADQPPVGQPIAAAPTPDLGSPEPVSSRDDWFASDDDQDITLDNSPTELTNWFAVNARATSIANSTEPERPTPIEFPDMAEDDSLLANMFGDPDHPDQDPFADFRSGISDEIGTEETGTSQSFAPPSEPMPKIPPPVTAQPVLPPKPEPKAQTPPQPPVDRAADEPYVIMPELSLDDLFPEETLPATQTNAPSQQPSAALTDDDDWFGQGTSGTSTSQPAASDTPDWFSEPAATPTASTGTPDDDMPDWFSDPSPAPANTPQSGFSLDDDDTPNWFGQSTSTPSTSVTPAASTITPDDDTPDWFSEPAATPAASTITPDDDTPDWFSEPAATPAASTITPDDDMPDWFSEPAATPSASSDDADWLRDNAPGLPAAESGELPDWLQSSLPTYTTPPPTTQKPAVALDDLDFGDLSDATPAPSVQDDVPEWMRGVEPIQAPATPSVEASADLNLDWLDAVDETTQQPAQATRQPTDKTPDLSAFGFNDPTPVAETSPGLPSASDIDELLSGSFNIDDILTALPASGVLKPPPTPGSESGLTVAPSQFDFSQDDAIEKIEKATGVLPTVKPEQIQDPDDSKGQRRGMRSTATMRLQGAPPAPGAPTLPSSLQPTQEDQQDQPTVLPDWIADLRPSDVPVVLRVGDQEVRITETPLGQLTDELKQLRERTKTAGLSEEEGTGAPVSGPLSGIVGAIGPATGLIKPAMPTSVEGAIITDQQARRVKLLTELLNVEDEMINKREGVQERNAPMKVAKPARVKIDRVIVTLLLAAVVAAPFFTDALNLMAVPGAATLSDAQSARLSEVARAVDSVATGSPVLVAFEYAPTATGELDDMARTLLVDLIRKGARPIIVSTNAATALHAVSLTEKMGRDAAILGLLGRTEPLRANVDYTVLRYLSGGTAGVRLVTNALQDTNERAFVFATDISGASVTIDVDAMRRNPAFVLTESADDVRTWAEQYRFGTSFDVETGTEIAPSEQLQIVLLAASGAASAAEVYAAEERILGPMISLRDTLSYSELRNARAAIPNAERLEDRWHSIGLGSLIGAVVILFGTAINSIRSLRRRRS